MDHTQWLGDTIEAIAGEKAGIIKPGAVAILAQQPQVAAAEVVLEHAAAVGATVLVTVAAHLHGSAPGLQPITPGRIATAPPRVAPPPARLSAPPPNLYRVVAGDSMSAIAARYGVSLIDLARANPQVHNLGLIHIGDLLHLA